MGKGAATTVVEARPRSMRISWETRDRRAECRDYIEVSALDRLTVFYRYRKLRKMGMADYSARYFVMSLLSVDVVRHWARRGEA